MNQRRKVSIFLSLILVLSFVFGSFGESAFAEAGDKTIRLVHLNDIHARVAENEREGAMGFAKLKTVLDGLKKENPNTLVISAGDTFHGTTEVNVSQGEAMTKFMNMAGFDLMVPGNHDFNFGYERLLELKDMCNFPIITANVYEKSGETKFDAYTIKEVDGIKLGIFGLTTEETAFKTHPDNVKNVDFKDPVEEAKKAVEALKNEKVDLIVGVTHMGVEGTTKTTTEELIKKVDGIDLVIDGHSHEETNEKINNTLLVQAGSYTKNVGVLDLKFKDNKLVESKEKLIKYEEVKELEGDKEVAKALEDLKEANKEILGVVVGETKVDLDGERGDVRTKETNLGNLVADIMMASANGDIAFTNGGGIRTSKPAGKLTKGDIIEIVPFTNTLAVIEVTGQELLEGLERGVDSYPEEAGHFPQVSGIKYSFNPNKPVGSRVLGVEVKGEKLDLNKKYRLITNDFIAAGGDGYTMFEGKPFLEEGALLSDMFIAYLEKNKLIEPKLEGRVTIVDKPVEKPEVKELKIVANGKEVKLPEGMGEFVNKDGRILVPVRGLFEGLGHEVKWDQKTKEVKISEYVTIKIGQEELLVNGEKVKMDAKAEIKDSRTYVPVRFIAEALGYEVEYDKATNTVNMNLKVNEEVKPAA